MERKLHSTQESNENVNGDVTMNAKLRVELDVKIDIKTRCIQGHKKCFKLEVKICAIIDTRRE